MKISNSFKIKGKVTIIKIKNNIETEIYKSNNLIVYQGREWILPRIFNVDNPNITTYNKDMYLSWVSFGSGGAPDTSPLDPIPPENTDLTLANELVIDASKPEVYPDNGKKHPLDQVAYEQDPKQANRYLIARVEALLDETELVDQDINEIGLWISDSNDPLVASQFYLFARNTFPTIRKRDDFSLRFLWHIYV